ncbi:MAG TPA: hypothetical protein VLB01_03375 [Thermodesulfobacteriota bacterium]|nr:hypothetical protein [Thermodesulfobacteriota bacterium]
MDSDCVLITTDHSSYNWQWVVENAPLILDTRNATRRFPAERVRRL